MPRMAAAGLVLAVVLGWDSATAGEPIEVDAGGARLEIPAPADFVAVSRNSAALEQVMRTFVASTNTYLAGFVRRRDVEAVEAGEGPALHRYGMAQIASNLESVNVDDQHFRELLRSGRRRFERAVENIADRLRGEIDSIEDDLSQAIDDEVSLTTGRMKSLGVYVEQEDVLGFLTVQRYSTETSSSGSTRTVVGTINYVHADERLIFLYLWSTLRGEADLDWTRSAGKAWAEAVIAANADGD